MYVSFVFHTPLPLNFLSSWPARYCLTLGRVYARWFIVISFGYIARYVVDIYVPPSPFLLATLIFLDMITNNAAERQYYQAISHAI